MVLAIHARLFEVTFAGALLTSIALKGFYPAILLNLLTIFLPRAIRTDDDAVCLIPRRPIVLIASVVSVLLVVATVITNIVLFASDKAYNNFQANIHVFHAIGIYSAESEWYFVVFSLIPQLVLIALKTLYDKHFLVEDAEQDDKEPVHVSVVVVWGLGCGITAVLNPSYIFFPLLAIYTVVIGVCMLGPRDGQTIITWCAKISTGWSSVLLVCVGLTQNPSLSTTDVDAGIINWRDNSDDGVLVARNVVQFVMVYCTCYISRQLHNGWAEHSEPPHWAREGTTFGRILDSSMKSLAQAIRVAVRYRAAWLLPFFSIICIVGPTAASFLLLLVVFVGCFSSAPFDRFALHLYVYCSIMSLGVYFGNMFPTSPYLVQLLLANPDRDGVLVPLVLQTAVNGLVAVSWVLYKEGEKVKAATAISPDALRDEKLKHVKAELGDKLSNEMIEKYRSDWDALNGVPFDRDRAKATLEADLDVTTPIDSDEFAVVWGFLTFQEDIPNKPRTYSRYYSSPRSSKNQRHQNGNNTNGEDHDDTELQNLAEGLLANADPATPQIASTASSSNEADSKLPRRRHGKTVTHRPDAVQESTTRVGEADEALNETQYLQLRLTTFLHQHQNNSVIHVLRLFTKHFLFANTRNVTYIAVFIVGTVRTELDALHLTLLVFFCVFAAFDDLARRFWVLFIVYCQALCSFMFVLIAMEGKAFDFVFGNLSEDVRSVAGVVPLTHRWTLLYYLALIFVASVERATFLHRAPTLRQWLTSRDVAQLSRVPFVQRLRVYGVLVTLLTVLGFRVVFEPHTLFMLGYIALFMTSCLLITFDNTSLFRSLNYIWVCGVIYGGCTLLTLAFYQFPNVQSAVDSSLHLNATSGTCPSLCPGDIGMLKPSDNEPLTWLLLPSFLTVSLIAILVMQSTSEEAKQEEDRANSAPVKLFGSLQSILGAVIYVADGLYNFLLDEMNVVVWVSLFVASVADPGLLSFCYVLFFVVDWRGFVPLFFAGMHLLAVYLSRFSFWSFSFETHRTLEYLGLIRDASTPLHKMIIGPMVAFLACTVYVNTYAISGERRRTKAARSAEEEEAAVKEAAKKQSIIKEIAIALYNSPRLFAYEALLLAHITGSATSVRRFSGAIHVILVLVYAKIGRRFIATNLGFLRAALALELLLLCVTYLFILNLPPQELDDSQPFVPSAKLSSWSAYFGFFAPTVDTLMFFVAAVVVRFITARRGASDDELNEAESKTGYATYLEFARAHDGELTTLFASGAKTNVPYTMKEVLPDITGLPPSSSVERAVVRVACWTIPPAILTFVYGAGNLSLINTALCLGGMLMMAHRSNILRKPTKVWDRWELFCNAFQVLVVLCNLPPIAERISASPNVMQPLGLCDDDGTVIDFSWFRVILLWTVYLQRRVFENFFFATLTLELYDEQRNCTARRQQLDAWLVRQEEQDFQRATERQVTRDRKLDEIRKARRGEHLDTDHTTAIPLLQSPSHKPDSSPKIGADEGVTKVTFVEEEEAPQPLPPASEPITMPADKDNNESIDWAIIVQADAVPDEEATIGTKLNALLAAFTIWLATHTRLSKAEIAEQVGVGRQFLVVLVGFLSMHTALLCYLSFAINFTQSRTAMDSVMIISALVYAALVKPWPSPKFWTFCLVYITLLIIVKNTAALINRRAPFDDSAASIVSFWVYPVDAGLQTGTIFFNLIGDFINFGLVLFHLQVCDRDGVYAEEYAGERNVLENVRNRIGCGVDLYSVSLFLEFLSFGIGIAFYYGISGRQSGSFVDSVQSNLLPGDLVIFMLASVLLMALDRILYVTQSIRAKLGLHILLVLAFFVGFMVWSHYPHVNLGAGTAYFVIKQCYLFLSAYQIRNGYPRFRNHDPFKDVPRAPMSLLYIVYRSIPFVWELRCLLDWTFTRTTLKFMYWIKLEDIQHYVYMRRVDELTLLPPGTPVPRYMKALQGGLLFVILIFLLFFPLMVYSTFNPSLTSNYMTSLNVAGSFGSLSQWYSAGVLSQQDLGPVFNAFMNRFHPAVGDVIAGEGVTSQLVFMPQCSATSWDLGPSAQSAVMSALNASYYNATGGTTLDLSITLSRKYFTQNSESTHVIQLSTPLPSRFARSMMDFVSGATSSVAFTIPDVYIPYVRNKPDNVVFMEAKSSPYLQSACNFNFSLLYDPILMRTYRYTCMLCSPMFFSGNRPVSTWPEWECGHDGLNCAYWTFANTSLAPKPSRAMYFFVMSDMVPTNSGILPNVGIIALYTSFILVIGQVLRGALAGSALRTQLEDMGDPHRVDDLVESILLCQGSEKSSDLELEGLLYYELVDLLRTSDALLRVTGSRASTYLGKLKAV